MTCATNSKEILGKDADNDEIRPILGDHHKVRALYDLSRTTTYRLTAEGEIRAVKIKGRTLWLLASIEAYVARQHAPDLRSKSPNK